ncbi:hyaluronan mediated motility receptor-like [Palaemon carinicauda]|uniref:hyaluronan mediated motility receptor-like n=1 Tax=Palaemon carinicauda TaxID=392227 RepID=UPI0035B5A3B8
MFPNNALRAISEYGKKYLVGGPSSEDGFQDQQPRLMELEGLRLILGGGLLMRKFWPKEEQSEELHPVLDQEELDGVSEDNEAVISGKDPLLSGEEEQLLLPGGAGSVISTRDIQVQVDPGLLTSNRDIDVQVQTEHLISNREVEVQVEPGPISNTDVSVQTDLDTKEEQSEELQPVLDQEELDGVSEEKEAVISGKDPLLSGEEEQLLLPGGAGSVISTRDIQVQVDPALLTSNRDIDVQVQTEHLISNREVEVQVEPGPISNTDVSVQTDLDAEIEDLRRENQTMAKELSNKQAVIVAHQNQLVDYDHSIQELKAELKMAQEKNDVQNQIELALVREKEALKQELEDKVTLDTMKIVQLNQELEKAKKEIEAHDQLKSILLAQIEDLKKSNEERSLFNEELSLEKSKLQQELMEARANDHKRRQGHQRLVEELQEEISKSLVQNRELKEAVFTITKKNEGLREQLENKGKREKNLNGRIVRMTNTEDQLKKELSAAMDVISSLKKELQKRDLEKVKKEEGTGDEGSSEKEKCGLDKTSVVEGCETPAEDDKKIVIVKEEKQEGEGPTRKLLVRKPKKKKPKRAQGYSWGPLGPIVPVLETDDNKVHNERTEENIKNN